MVFKRQCNGGGVIWRGSRRGQKRPGVPVADGNVPEISGNALADGAE